ncbi:MAG TPA: hypothetical protein VLE93_02095 [Candidatus Saccharimonadales bacterium]|nr:hypothetical protein [Candidatus Saccharimonadales bacterium]
MSDHEEMYVCEHCGHATSVASDVCPNCGEPMTHEPVKAKKGRDDIDDDLTDDALLSDKEIAAGAEENTVSLDALRAEEEEDEPAYGSEYGNE